VNASEYENLARVEGAHWYYAGKRELVRRWFARFGRPNATDTLLDCGAGTGRFAEEMQAHCRVCVLDDHAESLALLRQRFPTDQVLALTPEGIPLAAESVDLLTALDVLEHIAEDGAALADMHRVLRPGGLMIATVPAGMELWSDWDVSLHHHRRYSRRTLRALFAHNGWEILHLNYTNVLVYPAVWLVRRWQKAFPSRDGVRAEDKLPAAWLNRFLNRVFVWTGLCRLPFPRGVSLIMVARRR